MMEVGEKEKDRGLRGETIKGRRDTAGCKETEEKCQDNGEMDEGRRNAGGKEKKEGQSR